MQQKVLIVTNHMEASNGVSVSLMNLLHTLDLARYDVTVSVFYRCTDYATKLPEGVRLRRIFGRYFHGLQRLVHLLPKRALYRLAKGKGKYDIEIAYENGTPTLALAHSNNAAAKKVAWMHTRDSFQCEERKKFDYVVTVSESGKRRAAADLPNAKIKVLLNVVPDAALRDKARQPLDIGVQPPVVCSVGRLSAEKGFDRLLRCHERLLAVGIEHTLWIVGDGDQREILRDYVRTRGLNRVMLFGFDPNPYRYIARADLYVCSSNYEGMSTSCTEALLLGVPVLTTEVDGARELVADGCGEVVDNDENALYEGLLRALTNPELIADWKSKTAAARQRLGYEARAAAARAFFMTLETDRG